VKEGVEQWQLVAQKDRISVDVADLKQKIEACRTDAAWGELPLTGKIRTLVIERIAQLEQGANSSNAPPCSDTEILEMLIGFLNSLLDHHDHDGYSLAEIGKLLGREDGEQDLIALITKLRGH
jgi:hypothetical protein